MASIKGRFGTCQKFMLIHSINLANPSIVPEALEPGRRQLGVAHRMLDVAMPELGLQRTGIDALVRQLVAAGVPKHVGVDRKTEPGCDAEPRDQLAKAGGRERRSPLGRENER